MDGSGNKFAHKTQLIEIDKLIINNGPTKQQHGKSSRSGVWHQVSKLSLFPALPSSNFYFHLLLLLLLPLLLMLQNFFCLSFRT